MTKDIFNLGHSLWEAQVILITANADVFPAVTGSAENNVCELVHLPYLLLASTRRHFMLKTLKVAENSSYFWQILQNYVNGVQSKNKQLNSWVFVVGHTVAMVTFIVPRE